MDLRSHLRDEFARRHRGNRLYSRRAFAQSLGLTHTTLSRLLRGERRVSAPTIRRLAGRLGLSPQLERQAVLHEGTRTLLGAIRHPAFRPDSRRLAMLAGMSIDDVNIALQSLLRMRRLTCSHTSWTPEVP